MQLARCSAIIVLALAPLVASRALDVNFGSAAEFQANKGRTLARANTQNCAQPPCTDPGPTNVQKRIGGTVTLVNCVPSAASNAVVKIGSANVPASGALTKNTENNIVLTYSKTYPAAQAGSFLLTPSVSGCSGGAWIPTSRTVSSLPATGQNFVYTKGTPINLFLVAASLTAFLKTAELHLDNYNPATEGLRQGSYFKFGTNSVPLTINKATIDLDCGIICPDLGDADFYVTNLNMNKLTFSTSGNALKMQLEFESDGKEIKGIYNPGSIDDIIPDFEVDNLKVVVTATPKATTLGAGLTLSFGPSSITTNIKATGGCSYLGFDLCNFIFGSSGKVKQAIQSAIDAALGSQMLQDALAKAIKDYLATVGITTNIKNFGLYDGSMYVELAGSSLVNGLGDKVNGVISDKVGDLVGDKLNGLGGKVNGALGDKLNGLVG